MALWGWGTSLDDAVSPGYIETAVSSPELWPFWEGGESLLSSASNSWCVTLKLLLSAAVTEQTQGFRCRLLHLPVSLGDSVEQSSLPHQDS